MGMIVVFYLEMGFFDSERKVWMEVLEVRRRVCFFYVFVFWWVAEGERFYGL